MTILRVLAGVIAILLATACSESNPSTPTPPPASPPPPPVTPPPASSVTISGTVTFDLVPFNSATNGLNYNAVTQAPARGIVIEALNSSGSVLSSTRTNSSGQYSVSVDAGVNVRIRARARMVESSVANWIVTARDNTNSNAEYVLDGALTDSGSSNSTRNLNAASGWGGTSYTSTRAAAPFALLDVVYEALTLINGAAPGTTFPELQIYWSPDNRAADGDIADGDIVTTSFRSGGGLIPTILVLGNAGVDTDEYDRHVIAHEFGHYVESQLSRSDSIGGPHSLGERLDPRLAMGEGWGNAFSAISEMNPVYRDSSGAMQSVGFSFNIESNSGANPGWFSEASVQSIIYDLFDSANDGADGISAGFTPILASLTDNDYIDDTAPVTIFSFINSFRANSSVSDAAINTLLAGQSINGTGSFGAGETNDGGIPSVLPVVQTLTVGGGAIIVCSVDDAGTTNKLGNYDFMRLTIGATGTYTLSMTRTSGPTGRDPDFHIFQAGGLIDIAGSGTVDIEVLTRNLTAGDYWIAARDFYNIDDTAGAPGDVCYTFTAS